MRIRGLIDGAPAGAEHLLGVHRAAHTAGHGRTAPGLSGQGVLTPTGIDARVWPTMGRCSTRNTVRTAGNAGSARAQKLCKVPQRQAEAPGERRELPRTL